MKGSNLKTKPTSQKQDFLMSFFDWGIKKKDAKPSETYTLEKLLKTGIGQNFKDLLEPVKSLKYQSKEYKEAKAKLPYFTPSGTFSQRNNKGLISLSGLMLNDYDLQANKGKNTEKIIKQLRNDPYVLALFRSPSGGIKFFVKVELPNNGQNKYLEYYKQQIEFFEHKHGIDLDASQGKLSQPCFISYDPDYHYNPASKIYSFYEVGIDKALISQNSSFEKTYQKSSGNRFESKYEYAEYLTQRKHSFTEGQRHNYVCVLSLLLNRLGISQSEAEQYINGNYPYFAQHPTNAINSAYQNTQDFNTLKFTPYSEFIKMHPKQITPSIQPDSKPFKSVFIVKPFNETIKEGKEKEPILYLFGEFICKGELCMLFADNGTGKSLLACQIAEAVGNGSDLMGFKNKCEPMTVLYFDFELSDRNLANRYPNKKFPANVKRVELDTSIQVQDNTWQEALLQSIRQEVQNHEAGLLIIDNLSAIASGNINKNNVATKLITALNRIKKDLGVTILVISHPSKELKEGMPISKDQLSGSKQLTNLVDSCFAIGRSLNNNEERYLKQLKARNTALIYGSNNVAKLAISINQSSNVEFEFLGFTSEAAMLRSVAENKQNDEESQMLESIKSLLKEGKTQNEIAKDLGISQSKISRLINKHKLKT